MIPDRITWRVHGLNGNKYTVDWVRSDLHEKTAAALSEAQAEIERLREALRQIVKASGNSGVLASHNCGKIARAALSPKTPDTPSDKPAPSPRQE